MKMKRERLNSFLVRISKVLVLFVAMGFVSVAQAADYDKTYNFTTQTDPDNADWTFTDKLGTGLQAPNTDRRWSWDGDTTVSGDVGPLGPQEGTGGYVHTETSGGTSVGDIFTMELANGLDGSLYSLNVSFYVSADNNGETVTIEADAWDGTQWNNLLNRGGATVADWDFYNYSFDTYTNADVKVRFRVTLGGTTWGNDIAFDTIRLYGNSRNDPPVAPILSGDVFSNAAMNQVAVNLQFVADDPDGSSMLEYQIQIDDNDDIENSPLIDCASTAGCGEVEFLNTVNAGNVSPFTENEKVQARVTGLVNGTTYVWRVRARDVSGSGSYGAWSELRSFTVTFSETDVAWHQSMSSQFAQGTLESVEINPGNYVEILTAVEGELLTTATQGTWGTGTTNPDDPLNVYYHDSRGQSVYLASELTAAGLSAGEITALSLLPNELTTRPNLAQFRLRMKHTNAATMTEWEGGWTDVYGPVDVPVSDLTAGTWKEFTLTTPFVWDGVSNIVLDISRDDTSYTTAGGLSVRTGLASGRTISGRCDSCAPAIYTRTATGTGDSMAQKDFVPMLKLKTSGVSSGTIMSEPVDYSLSPLTNSWKNFDWSEDETTGAVSMQLYYATGAGNCDAIVPDSALPGNSSGFASAPVDISKLDTATYDRICMKATLSDVGGSPKLNDWMVRWLTATTLTQTDYRWYRNANSMQPGTALGEESTFIRGVANSDVLRLRMNLKISSKDWVAGTDAFKLQYAEGRTCSELEAWTDVDIAGEAGIWRGYNNSGPADGAALTNGGYLLSSSDIAESYEEYNDSVLNPRSGAIGHGVEWDWVLQNNGALNGTSYCFRMVKTAGNPLDYTEESYPRLVTTGAYVEQMNYHWRNDDGSESTATSATAGFENTSLGVPKVQAKRLRIGFSNHGSAISSDIAYRLEYGEKVSSCAEVATWSDVGAGGGDWDMADSVYLTNGQNVSNITESIGGVADTNTFMVTNNQGVHDQTSVVTPFALEKNEFSELEFSIKALAGATAGTSYCFRLTDAGTELGNYTVYPEATIGGVTATLGKTLDGWGGVIPVYLSLDDSLNPAHYPYVRAQVTTPAPESEVHYTAMEWDAVNQRYEGEIKIGSWHCPGCVHPRAGDFQVEVQMDDQINFSSVDFADNPGTFQTFITRRRSSLSRTELTDFNPIWNTDHWEYTIKELGLYQISGITQSNVVVPIPFHPITSAVSNIGVTYGGVAVTEGGSTSTGDVWWWDIETHTLYLMFGSMLTSDNDTNLVDVGITFNTDTDLWMSRYDHVETQDMGERLFYNGLMIANKSYTTFVYGGAGEYGHANWEGSGAQAESRVHEPGQDDDTMDCMERVAVHVNDVPTADGSGYYEYNIKWKQSQWKDYIVTENNNQMVIVVDSDDTPGTGWAQQIDSTKQVAVKRRQSFTAGKRSITNSYEITNNHPTLTHKLPLVWQREQWLSTKAGSERQINDRGRFAGDTVDRTMEQRVRMNTLPEPWLAAYDDAQFVALSIIFNNDDVDNSTYGVFASEAFLTTSSAEWPINITNPHAEQWAEQTGFEHTFEAVAPGETVKFRFSQFIADEESWQNIQNGVEVEFEELNGAQPTFSQRDYRWYEDNDALTPTDPMGTPDLDVNEAIELKPSHGSPNQGDELRLRINLNVNTADMNFGRKSFKLQYKEGTDGNCTTGTWTDVEPGRDWGFARSSVANGADVTTILPSSKVGGQYAKENPTAVTSKGAFLGEQLEYDFHLQAENVNSVSSYSFRVVNADDTLLTDGYLNCPTLKTSPQVEDDMRHGLFFGKDSLEKFFFWVD